MGYNNNILYIIIRYGILNCITNIWWCTTLPVNSSPKIFKEILSIKNAELRQINELKCATSVISYLILQKKKRVILMERIKKKYYSQLMNTEFYGPSHYN